MHPQETAGYVCGPDVSEKGETTTWMGKEQINSSHFQRRTNKDLSLKGRKEIWGDNWGTHKDRARDKRTFVFDCRFPTWGELLTNLAGKRGRKSRTTERRRDHLSKIIFLLILCKQQQMDGF